MTPEQSSRLNIHYVLVQADRQYANDHLTNALPPDRMDVLIRAVETNIGSTAVRELEGELANARGCLARLLEAVNGAWSPGMDVGAQTWEALRQVHAVEAYFQSLNNEQEVA
jgi:hypothetical protein